MIAVVGAPFLPGFRGVCLYVWLAVGVSHVCVQSRGNVLLFLLPVL